MSTEAGAAAKTAGLFAGLRGALLAGLLAGLATRVDFGAETVLFDFALLADFFAGLLAAFLLADFLLETFLATGFRVFLVAFFAVDLAVLPAFFLLVVLLAVFFTFFTTRLARFFAAAALLARTLEALRTFFVEAFFLGDATTISFIAQTGLPGM